jgi:hypothetical protein
MKRLMAVMLVLGGWLLYRLYVPIADREGLPEYVRLDRIAQNHKPEMRWTHHSIFPPDSQSMVDFLRDYAALWAHLNNLRQTNDVQAGKAYYTENWFRQICRNPAPFQADNRRHDLSHYIGVENWSQDKLICTLSDTVKLRYEESGTQRNARALVWAVMLKQGDHWRLDAIRFGTEEPMP